MPDATSTPIESESLPAATNGHADVVGAISSKNTLAPPPPGYFGNLSDAQQTAFDTFKRDVEARFGPSREGEVWFSDDTILRYLRARRFDPTKAMAQFAATDEWRKSFGMDDVYSNFDTQELFHSQRHYPRYVGRRDKNGKPICVYRPGSLTADRQKEIFAVEENQSFKRIAVMTEFMMQFSLPMATYVLRQEHGPSARAVTDVTSIVDFEGSSLRLLWTLRNHLKRASVLSSAHYPETLGSLALVNTPGFFSTIWSWVQKWFDEGTRNKMFVVSAAELNSGKLCELIAKENLPRVYGGELDWRYEDEPALDPAFIKALGGMNRWPHGTAAWRGETLYVFDPQERAEYPNARAPPSNGGLDRANGESGHGMVDRANGENGVPSEVNRSNGNQ